MDIATSQVIGFSYQQPVWLLEDARPSRIFGELTHLPNHRVFGPKGPHGLAQKKHAISKTQVMSGIVG